MRIAQHEQPAKACSVANRKRASTRSLFYPVSAGSE